MAKSLMAQETALVEEFILGAKELFSAKIARNEITEIGITSMEDKSPAVVRYNVSGPVATKSPTGKSKIYKYVAQVDLNKEDGSCTLAGLKIDDTQV